LEIDLARPAQGLHKTDAARAEGPSSLLGWNWRPDAEELVQPPADWFVRDRVLTAVYAGRLGVPWDIQVDWHVVAPVAAWADVQCIVDVVVSVQTDLLEAYPTVLCRTVCDQPAARFWQADPASGFAPWDGIAAPLAASWSPSPCGGRSYLEFGVPDDFALLRPAPGATSTCWEYQPSFQEKGVIRRLRMRAVWLTADVSPQVVARCWADLAAQPLPLST
jgi:hypothetical protein